VKPIALDELARVLHRLRQRRRVASQGIDAG